jgi:hypothetical protein
MRHCRDFKEALNCERAEPAGIKSVTTGVSFDTSEIPLDEAARTSASAHTA